MNLQKAINRNRQKQKARRLLHDIRLRTFNYEDAGKTEKAQLALSTAALLSFVDETLLLVAQSIVLEVELLCC